jgi:tetratricopeptide (TPR) repeat protein
MRGSPEEVEPFLGWFEQVIDRGGPPVERMMAHASIATYAYVRARYERASHHLERGMALFAPAEHAGVVQSYGGCGGFYSHIITIGVLWQTGRLDEAWRHARATVVQAEALDPYALASALGYEMSLHLAAGDVAQTEALADRMLELATRYEFPYMICSALCHRGWALARRGQAERAMTDLVMATEGTRRMGIKVWYPYFLGLYADSAIALGQWDRAERALDEALEVCRTSVDCGNEPELLRLRGQLILGRDASAHAPARAAFADALAVAQRRGALTAALRTATDLAALLRDDHLPGEAIAVLGPVFRGFAPGLDDRNLAAARQLLAELPAGPA